MNAGRFSKSHESSGDLNRSPESRGSQTSGVLLVLFVQAKRIKPFLFGKLRGFANLDSARRNGGFAQTKLKPVQKKIRGSANLESTHLNNKFALAQLNPLPLRGFFRRLAATFFRLRRCPAGTARSACFFALLFVKHKKQGKKNFPFGKFFYLHPLHRQFRHNIVVHKSPQEQPTQSVSVCAEGFHEP